jgi:hypothetical protein
MRGIAPIQKLYSYPGERTIVKFRNTLSAGTFEGWGYDINGGDIRNHVAASNALVEKALAQEQKRKTELLFSGFRKNQLGAQPGEAKIYVKGSYDAPVNRTVLFVHQKRNGGVSEDWLQIYSAPQGTPISLKSRDYIVRDKQIETLFAEARNVFVADGDRFFVHQPDSSLVCVDLTGRHCGS